MYGFLTNNSFKLEKCNKYLDDDDVYIAIDGLEEDELNLNNIKELYILLGKEFVQKIFGFYSIYLYDKKRNRIILVRDKMGTKPVYYYKNNDGLFFGNDIMEIVENYEIKKEINIQALSMYFRYDYINPPETIFRNIFKLGHGQYLILDKGKIKVNTYWDLIEKFNNKSKEKIKDLNTAKKIIENDLNSFIKQILKKEKKIGIYLSSGIDSSLVTALCVKNSKKKINTYSIGFSEKERNEAIKSKRIADYLGTKHHELYLNKNEILKAIKKIPYYYKEPFADSSEIPTIILNEFAKKNNIEIAMTGDGADQLFCGMSLYDKILSCHRAYKIINPLNLKLKNSIIKNTKLAMIYSNNDKRYQAQSNILRVERVFENLFKDKGAKRFKQEDRINSKSWQEKRMILDLDTFTADDITTKMGLAANNNGIEIRSPFLQDKLIENSFRISHSLKYHHKNKKYILKQILYDYIPKKYFDDQKRGFGPPRRTWLKEFLYNDLTRLSKKEFIEKQNIFNYEKVCDLVKNVEDYKNTSVLWNYCIFQLWYEKYMTN